MHNNTLIFVLGVIFVVILIVVLICVFILVLVLVVLVVILVFHLSSLPLQLFCAVRTELCLENFKSERFYFPTDSLVLR